MIAEERRAILLKEMNEVGYVQATELASHFALSAATIRRDLSFLEKQGLCIRKRGGAIRSAQGVTLELPYETKQNQNIAEKKRIAEAAAKLVEDGNTLILDAGSTTYALALLLQTKQRITVVTNDLHIAVKLASNPNISLICTGGIARPNVFSLQGSQVESFIKNLKVDQTFLGADAIHKDCTVSNVNIEEVPIKQAMLHAAKQKVLLADSSKFNKIGFVKVCDLTDVDIIITDKGVSKEITDLYQTMDIQMIVV
jgi:DeoR/GlpR family transcriptional regulator of sugar metabolism